MSLHKIDRDQGAQNRNRILAEVLRQPGRSRTDIGREVGLNVASVSRITRDLIDGGLINETDAFGPKGRPGRRFVGLKPNGAGGYVIGMGLNAFRQSVTLADLENRKIAEWVSEDPPGNDGQAFMLSCVERAKDMVDAHVPARERFFGVGVAVAGDLDQDNGVILRAPVLGWDQPVALKQMVDEVLKAPMVMDTPTSAINKAEADCGLGAGIANLTTLHCSLRFGIGIKLREDQTGAALEFGRVLTDSKAPDGSGKTLSETCGGLAVLSEIRGDDVVLGQSDSALSAMLVDVIDSAAENEEIQRLLTACGKRTAEQFSLAIDLCRPERLLLAGALAQSSHYVSGFTAALKPNLGLSSRTPEILCSDMTPTGASRWLSLRENVAMGNLNLTALKQESAA